MLSFSRLTAWKACWFLQVQVGVLTSFLSKVADFYRQFCDSEEDFKDFTISHKPYLQNLRINKCLVRDALFS